MSYFETRVYITFNLFTNLRSDRSNRLGLSINGYVSFVFDRIIASQQALNYCDKKLTMLTLGLDTVKKAGTWH